MTSLCCSQVEWRRARSVALDTADAVLTHYVIMTLNIISWRSILMLYDVILSSAVADPVFADVLSVSIGVIACSFMLVMDDVTAKVSCLQFHGVIRHMIDTQPSCGILVATTIEPTKQIASNTERLQV